MQDVLGSQDEGFHDVENSVLVEAGLAALDERERRIVELRFFEGLTQSEIAARVGISQMHVSRLLRRRSTRCAAAGGLGRGRGAVSASTVTLGSPRRPST